MLEFLGGISGENVSAIKKLECKFLEGLQRYLLFSAFVAEVKVKLRDLVRGVEHGKGLELRLEAVRVAVRSGGYRALCGLAGWERVEGGWEGFKERVLRDA